MASALYGAHAEQQNQDKGTTFGYVVNADDNTVSVIDNGSNKVVATIPVGLVPNGVAITPNGPHPYKDDYRGHQSLAYVTNGPDDTVSVIDIASNTVVATIPVRQEPFGVAITSDGTRAYVTNQLDDSVSVIDTASNTVVDTISEFPEFVFPTGMAITPVGTGLNERDDRRHQPLAYVTNNVPFIDGSNLPASTVSVINTASNTVVATIPVGQNPTGVAITPDGTHAYVANNAIPTDGPINSAGVVAVIDTTSNKVLATIPVGSGPVGVAITPNATDQYERVNRPHQPFAYVTNLVDNTVSVIDTANNKVVATIRVGTGPFAVAFATVTPSNRNAEQ